MQAGKLNTRIAIQTATDTVNSSGERVSSWATTLTVWARIVTAGREFMAAQQRVQRLSHILEIRPAAVTAGQRVLVGSRVLDIQSAYDPDGTNRRMLLDCIENT